MDMLTLEVLAATQPLYPTIFKRDDDASSEVVECAKCAPQYFSRYPLSTEKTSHVQRVLSCTTAAPEAAGCRCVMCQKFTEVL